nr:uncharacterized protein CTRU02_00384 [Colletotrichum truncatum]KAF6801635.1 hypothetical protein CTRU02_00384 [Colletotrichum truncatum]
MRSVLAFSALLLSVAGIDIPSFAPPQFPPSTIQNDGTNVGRYDVRKHMAWLDPGDENLSSYFFLLWVTLTDGRKYHVTVAPNHFFNMTTGIYVLNDLQNLEAPAVGGTAMAPGVGRDDQVFLQSIPQNFSSPAGGDNYTTLQYSSDFSGVKIDVTFNPTGKNLYVGGSGGVTIGPSSFVKDHDDYRRLIPGYSWYWGNPTMRVNGTIEIDGRSEAIDYDNSFAFFERQSGVFGIPGGHLGFWLYLSNGIMIHTWTLAPTTDGTLNERAWATVWHPDGLHEVVEIAGTSRALEKWVSPVTGLNYFSQFRIDMPTRNASFQIQQYPAKGEVTAGKGYKGYNITEAYGQGTGTWDGQNVSFFGHVEQLSFLGGGH